MDRQTVCRHNPTLATMKEGCVILLDMESRVRFVYCEAAERATPVGGSFVSEGEICDRHADAGGRRPVAAIKNLGGILMRIRTMLATLVAISIAMVSVGLNMMVANAQNCGVAPPGGVGNCLLEQSTMAGVVVDHFSSVDSNIVPVEPDNVDSWVITATHSTVTGAGGGTCSCKDYISSVSATVSWTGSSWSVSCTGCNYPSAPS